MLFLEATDGKIQAGLLISKVNTTLTVHMIQQAQKRRFVPLYRLKSGAVEPKEKPPGTAEMAMEVVEQHMVLASTMLEKCLIPDSSLPNLQSRGIIVNPLVQDTDEHVTMKVGQGEPLVFPITRMTKREQQIYMSALRTLCKALRISPFASGIWAYGRHADSCAHCSRQRRVADFRCTGALVPFLTGVERAY